MASILAARRVTGLLALLLLLTDCATQGGTTRCQALAAGPIANLAYPAPGSTNVADTIKTVILLGTIVQPVALVGIYPSPNTSPIPAMPTALPSPLPTPIATPYDSSYKYFAVSVPTLTAGETYQVQALETNGGCLQESEYVSTGQFAVGTH